MKKIQIGLAALLLSISVSFAQPPAKQADKKPGFHKREMGLQQLNLTDAQKTQLKSINEDFRKQMQAINSNENQTVKQQRTQREALAKAHKAKVESVLTADQKAQLAKLHTDGKERFRKMEGERFENLKGELSLTDQQVASLKAGQDKLKSQMEAIRNDQSLDRTAKMEKMKALRDEMKKNFDQVLTPEQKTKWQGMRKDRMQHMKHRSHKSAPTPPPAA